MVSISKHDEEEDVEDKENESGAINLQASPLQDAHVNTPTSNGEKLAQ